MSLSVKNASKTIEIFPIVFALHCFFPYSVANEFQDGISSINRERCVCVCVLYLIFGL